MKKIMYELEDVAQIFLIFGYFSLAIGAWELVENNPTFILVVCSADYPKSPQYRSGQAFRPIVNRINVLAS